VNEADIAPILQDMSSRVACKVTALRQHPPELDGVGGAAILSDVDQPAQVAEHEAEAENEPEREDEEVEVEQCKEPEREEEPAAAVPLDSQESEADREDEQLENEQFKEPAREEEPATAVPPDSQESEAEREDEELEAEQFKEPEAEQFKEPEREAPTAVVPPDSQESEAEREEELEVEQFKEPEREEEAAAAVPPGSQESETKPASFSSVDMAESCCHSEASSTHPSRSAESNVHIDLPAAIDRESNGNDFSTQIAEGVMREQVHHLIALAVENCVERWVEQAAVAVDESDVEQTSIVPPVAELDDSNVAQKIHCVAEPEVPAESSSASAAEDESEVLEANVAPGEEPASVDQELPKTQPEALPEASQRVEYDGKDVEEEDCDQINDRPAESVGVTAEPLPEPSGINQTGTIAAEDFVVGEPKSLDSQEIANFADSSSAPRIDLPLQRLGLSKQDSDIPQLSSTSDDALAQSSQDSDSPGPANLLASSMYGEMTFHGEPKEQDAESPGPECEDRMFSDDFVGKISERDDSEDQLDPIMTVPTKGLGTSQVKQQDINAADEVGMTPLHRAVLSGSTERCAELLHQGADPQLRDLDFFCPLHYAARFGNVDMIDALMQGGAETESEARGGITALHLAIQEVHEEAALFLIQHSTVDVIDQQDQEGRTPLHYAASSEDSADIAAAIVLAGGDPDKTDFSGISPRKLAKARGLTAVLRALEQGQTINLEPSEPEAEEETGGEARPFSDSQQKWGTDSQQRGGTDSSVAFDDMMITGRGEVWVARPMATEDALSELPSKQPHLSSRSEPDELDARKPEVSWGTSTVMMGPPESKSPHTQTASSGRLSRPSPVSKNLTEVPGFGTYQPRFSPGKANPLVGSVLDRSVTDDWIVVDSDDEEADGGAGAGREAGSALPSYAQIATDGKMWEDGMHKARTTALTVGRSLHTALNKGLGKLHAWTNS